MTILTHHELTTYIAEGLLMTGSDPSHVNASSVDVTLGAEILYEHVSHVGYTHKVTLRDRQALWTDKFDLRKAPFTLYPGQFVLAHTEQLFYLPPFISAEFRLKSSAARMGLSHALAVWCDPGWHGSALTLELHNVSQYHAVRLQLGDRIGQMIFHHHATVSPEFSYAAKGSYNNDTSVSGAKPPRKEAP